MVVASAAEPVRTIGRYALFDEIAAGGMATVHLGRLLGPVGFSRTVAIKRLHTHFAKDPEFAAGFVDEARLAARIHHPNVVPIIDVLSEGDELSLVMDYVEGDSLAKLLRHTVTASERVPLPIVSAIICGSLYGLHAAHEAVDESGEPMHIVHRDISPQNILVGSDGVPRIVDFGVAKAAQRLQTTAEGQVKGKIAYMAPEQIRQAEISRKSDIYAMGVVLWESLAGARLFQSENHANLMSKVLDGAKTPPSRLRPECSAELDALVMKALDIDAGRRFETAREMAAALQKCVPPAPPTDVGDWVNALARDSLTDRRKVRKRVESRDLSAGSEIAEEFLSRPSTEELLTVVDRPRLLPEDDSTQAVTGTTSRNETSRLFLPLVLGLTTVIGGVLVLLLLNRPQLAEEQAAPELQGAPSAQLEPQEPKPQVPTDDPSTDQQNVDTEGTASDTTKAPEDDASEASKTSTSTDGAVDASPPPSDKPAAQAPAVAPRPRVVKPACPKYLTDADGIQRINRKCWK